MIYTIIAEPRSGGQTLFKWLSLSLGYKFECIHEPFNQFYNVYTNDTTIQDFSWMNPQKNYIIKEIFLINKNYEKLISISDKILTLYRENIDEQSKSLFFAEKTKKHNKKYTQKEYNEVFNEKEFMIYKDSIEKSKPIFKEFIKYNNFEFITYEDLYYGDGYKKITDFFNFSTKIQFPPEPRYFNETPKLI